MGFSMLVEAETLPPDAAALNARYGHLAGEALLRPMIDEFRGRICLVSSFGAEAAVLLHMVAAVDRGTPVLFLDTQKHFPETLAYRDTLRGATGPHRRALAHARRRDGRGARSRRHAVEPQSRCLLRPAQGGAIEPRARRLLGLDLRPQALSRRRAPRAFR